MAAKDKGTDKQADNTAPATPAAPWAPVVATVKNDAPSSEKATESSVSEAPKNPEGITPPEAAVDTKVAVAKAEDKVREVSGEVVEMVTVTVPHDYNLRLDHFREFKFKAGVQEMEREVAEHWYSKANGVTVYEPSKK